MSDLTRSPATLAGPPGRDLLDAEVVTALAERLRPLAVALYRCVGAPLAPRLLLRASARRGEACLPGDAPWTPLHALPALAGNALYRRVAASGRPLVDAPAAADAPSHWRSHVYPLRDDGAACRGLLELLTDGSLTPAQQGVVVALLARHRDEAGAAGADAGTRDRLTGLPNRQGFEAEFGLWLPEAAPAALVAPAVPDGRWEARRAAVASRQWLGLIEIGRDARVDAHALQSLARRLRVAFRHGDRLYRVGEAAFAVLLRAESRAEVVRALARCRIGPPALRTGCTAVGAGDSAQAALARAAQAG